MRFVVRAALLALSTFGSAASMGQPVGWARHVDQSETDFSLTPAQALIAPDSSYYTATTHSGSGEAYGALGGPATFITHYNADGAILWSRCLSISFSSMCIGQSGL